MSYYTNTAGRRLFMPEPALEPEDCRSPEPPQQPAPKLPDPLPQCTLEQIKEYCEAWEDCPNDSRCAFYKMCNNWPFEWEGI